MEESKKELILRVEDCGSSLVEMGNVDSARQIAKAIIKHDIVKAEDKKFFIDNMERWNDVSTKCHTWRTSIEKKSILSEFCTTHQQFHQAILENKVFYQQTLLLDKEAKITKLEAEELYIDAENLQKEIEELKEDLINFSEETKEYRETIHKIKKKDIKLRKKLTELHEKGMVIKNQENEMNYRMLELRDWKDFEDKMLEKLHSEGYTDEQIWDKNYGQAEGNFLLSLLRYKGVKSSKDSAEIHNLTYLARFYVEEAIKDKKFLDYLNRCNKTQIESLIDLGYVQLKEKEDKSGYDIRIPQNIIDAMK